MEAHEPIRAQKIIRGHSVRAYYVAGVHCLANVKNDNSLHAAIMQLWQNMVDKKFIFTAVWVPLRIGKDLVRITSCH